MTSEKIKAMPREELEHYCSDLERRLIISDKNTERLTVRLVEITKDRNWMRGLLENVTIPIREKVTLYGAHSVLQKKEARADGLTHVYRSDISKLTGLTESQVGDSLKKLKDRGVIDRKIEPYYDHETGKHEKRSWMALEDIALRNPKAIDFSSDDNWGGKRKKKTCPHCGSPHLQQYTHTILCCKDCAEQIDENWKTKDVNSHTENNSEMENDN